MLDKYKGKLFCFSPPVMLATFIFEFGAAFYTIWRYKINAVARLTVLMLLALGTFQLTEYMTCGGLGIEHINWARLGYASITLLPALGIHLLVVIAGKKLPLLIGTAYTTCLAFLVFFIAAEGAVALDACYANYVVFNTHYASGWPYALYYYGWLIIGAYLAYRWSAQYPKRKKALLGMAIGYAAFIVPTTFFNLIDPSTTRGIPSIMCGFAVLFAISLIVFVLPNAATRRTKSQP